DGRWYPNPCPHEPRSTRPCSAENPMNPRFTRRSMIRSLVGGSLLLPGILSELLAQDRPAADVDPLAPKAPHFRARAKRVIFLNMSGGVSHVDSFDYKPKLIADHNKPYRVPQRMLEAFAP